jgi:hypothetical protein
MPVYCKDSSLKNSSSENVFSTVSYFLYNFFLAKSNFTKDICNCAVSEIIISFSLCIKNHDFISWSVNDLYVSNAKKNVVN